MSGCRIGKIKLKAGGEIHRLPTIQRDEPQQKFIDRAAMISGYFKPGEIMGFVLMAWDKEGHHSVGYYVDRQSVVGMTMVPSFAAETLRRRMIQDGDWETP